MRLTLKRTILVKKHKVLAFCGLFILLVYIFAAYKTVIDPECRDCQILVEPTNGTPSDYYIEPIDESSVDFEEIFPSILNQELGSSISQGNTNSPSVHDNNLVSPHGDGSPNKQLVQELQVLPSPSKKDLTNVIDDNSLQGHENKFRGSKTHNSLPAQETTTGVATKIYEKRNTFGLLIDELQPSKEMKIDTSAKEWASSSNSKTSSDSYRNYSLSKDLSRWNKYLSLSEDDPHITNYPMVVESPSITKSQPKRILTSSSAMKKRFQSSNPLYEITKNTVRPIIPMETITRPSSKERNKAEKLSAQTVEKTFPFHLDYSRLSYYPWKTTEDDCSHYATRFLRKGTGQVIPLASFPGSGNTWLRYISEALTGVFSGSLYVDDDLTKKGFWGEQDFYMEGTTLLQKTHSLPILPEDSFDWNGQMILGPPPRKVVLLMRSPYDAMIALRHFHVAGHVGIGHSEAFTGEVWRNFSIERAQSWFDLNKAWLELPDTKVLVLHYEKMMNDLSAEAGKLMNFLGVPEDTSRMSCLLRYPDGRFRRPRHTVTLKASPFPVEAMNRTNELMQKMNHLLRKLGHDELPLRLYKWRTSL